MGPMAVLGEFTEYLSFGARGLLVCRSKIGPGLDWIGSHEGTSYRTRLRSKCRICREPTADIGTWLRTRIDWMSVLERNTKESKLTGFYPPDTLVINKDGVAKSSDFGRY